MDGGDNSAGGPSFVLAVVSHFGHLWAVSVIQNSFLLTIIAWFLPPASCEQNDWVTRGKYRRVILLSGGQSMLLICVASEMHKNGSVN
jgi:hypothetical protein